jgi:limonene-1,2-epoxide hydrolase
MKKSSNWKRNLVNASVAALIAASAAAQAAEPTKVATAGKNEYERAAIKLVLDWTAAFAARDAAKVRSYMDDNAEFRLDPTERTLSQGQEALQKTLDMILPGIGGIKTLRIYAVGGPHEVLVISDRIDDFTMGGKKMAIPIGGFFRVNPQTHKIEEWLDAPLIKVDMPPPPAGGAPGPGAGNGAPAPK